MLRFILAISTALFTSVGAHAATMTFANVGGGDTVYTEDGITVTTTVSPSSTLDVPEGGTLSFTMARRFSVTGFDLAFIAWFTENTVDPTGSVIYEDLRLEGVRNGNVVASISMTTFMLNGFIAPGPRFRALDEFRLVTVNPPYPLETSDAYPSLWIVDNVTLAPVPVPAAAGLLLIGIGALASVRASRRPS